MSPRRTPAATPRIAAAGLAVMAGGALLLSAAPELNALVPPCPFRALTGLDCPFCGATRAVLSLARGDVAAAADYNLLVTSGVFLLIGLLAWWAVRRLRRPSGGTWTAVGPAPDRAATVASPRVLLIAGVAIAVVFWLVRNLPFWPYLASAT